MNKRGVIKIDWHEARRDFISENPIEAVHWNKYLVDHRSSNCLALNLSMNFLRIHGIGVKELAFTQYDITPGHDCLVNRSFLNVVQ